MTNETDDEQSTDASIAELTERLEEIIAQLEDGEVSLERMKVLHSEGQAILDDLRGKLDIGEGTVEINETS